MKNIKMYEDYSDEELDSLRDDLYKIGADERFEFGKDFGLNIPLKKSNDGTGFPCINKRMFSILLAKNIIKPCPGENFFTFTNDKEFNIPENFHSKILENKGSSFIVIQILSNYNKHVDRDEYIPIFDGVIKKLGEIRIWST